MNTSLLQRSISKVLPNRLAAATAEVILLFGIGVLAVSLHASLRMPMQLPGKQGLLFMTLILTARGMSRFPFAGSITGIGAATTLLLPGLGFHDPFMALNYLLLGCIIDVASGFISRFTNKTWMITLLCGACWLFIPLFRLFMSLFADIPLGMFRNGYLYPFMTYLLFGIAGGAISAGILTLSSKKS